MTTESENYPDKRAAQTAREPNNTRHLAGFETQTVTKNPDGTFTIVWSDTLQTPTPPRRQLTERQLLEELKPENVDIV